MMRRPKISTWLSWIADVAGDDYSARGMPRELLLSRNQVFLISRIAYQARRMPASGEKLVIRTWEKSIEAIWFNRDYEFFGADGALIASATSAWLLCNPETHRILRPRALDHTLLPTEKTVFCERARQLIAPANGTVLGERRVVYSDLDANGHLFSAIYGDIFMDFLPKDRRASFYSGFTINYVKEAKEGEVLKLIGAEADGHYTIAGFHAEGGVCFIAQMAL
jgi:acyl-ACP thioesterase